MEGGSHRDFAWETDQGVLRSRGGMPSLSGRKTIGSNLEARNTHAMSVLFSSLSPSCRVEYLAWPRGSAA